ncbi:MAG: hypothetical protein ACREDT_04550 [Methylocella sp.]
MPGAGPELTRFNSGDRLENAAHSGDWIGHVVRDGAILAMPEIGIDVALAEFYDGLVFDDQDEAKDGAPRTG